MPVKNPNGAESAAEQHRPNIIMGGQYRDRRDATQRAFASYNQPPTVFNFAGAVVRIVTDATGRGVPARVTRAVMQSIMSDGASPPRCCAPRMGLVCSSCARACAARSTRPIPQASAGSLREG